MINRLSNAINCNRLAAKFSKVMSSNIYTLFGPDNEDDDYYDDDDDISSCGLHD